MKKTSKILITMLSLVVLFAVFAFSASAVDYSGTISEDITLQDGDTIGATDELYITSPITITVDGTVTVKNRIRIGDENTSGLVVTIAGDNAETDILFVDSAFDTSLSRYIQVRNATLNMENVTLDGNGVGAQAVMGYNSGATINLNNGTVIKGSGSAIGALRGWGTYNVNAGASVISDNICVGLDSGAILNMNGGSLTAGAQCVVFRNSTAKVNYYSGTLTAGEGKAIIANNDTSIDGTVTVYQTWDDASDVVYTLNQSSFGLAKIDKMYITVSGQLNLTGTINIGQGVTAEFKGVDSTAALIGTGKANVFSLSNGTGYSGTTLNVESLIVDANTTSSTEARPVLLNGSTNMNLRSGGILKNGRRASANGGAIYIENGSVLNMYDGAKIIDSTSGGSGGGIFVNTTGTFNMYGGEISGHTSGSYGGGIRVSGTMYMYGGTISNNKAASYAGGIYINNGKLYILDDEDENTPVPTISNNSADRATVSTTSTYGGGAILTENANCVVVIEDAIFDSNTTSQNGGAIALMGGKATIYKATFTNNIAANNNSGAGAGIGGGGVWVHTNVTLDLYPEVTFSGNMKYQTANELGKLASGTINLHYSIYDAEDIIPDYATIKTVPFYTTSSKIVMDFYASFESPTRLYFGGDIPVDVVGHNIGTEEEPAYPVITKDPDASMSTSYVNIGSGAIVTMTNITFDVGLFDSTSEEVPATELRAVYMNSNSKLTLNSGAVIKGGYRNTSAGGGVYGDAGTILTINDGALITDCSARSGGAVYTASSVVMNGGSITNCTSNSGDGGGAVYVSTTGTFTMGGGTISGCSASNHGGAIFNWKGTVTISGGTITDNSASMGSAIRNYGPLTISGGTISNGTGNGAIVSSTSGTGVTGDVTISGTALITGNKVEGEDNSAGVYIVSGSLSMSGGSITNNIGGATSEGGAIRIANAATTVSITGGTISGNKAGYGGAIFFAQSEITLSDVTITGNEAFVKGGGIYIGSSVGSATISGATTITNNTLDGATCNIQKASGFKSYDDEVYADNNWPNGWIIIDGEFTGSVGVYFEALPLDMNFDEVKLGVILEGGSVSGTISNDNGKFTYAETTDASGMACISLAVASKNNLTVKFANGDSQSFEVPDFDFYALPTAGELTAPAGQFLGYVKVNGYGTVEVAAEAILAEGAKIAAAELENLYATWVNINTLTGASAQISENSGIRFFTTINDADLAAVGIKVKAGSAEGDGYYRGTLLGTSATDLTEALSKDNYKMDVKVNNTGWANAAAYGVAIDEGLSSFAVSITYGSDAYYNNAVAYRGYIEITVGETSVVVYSDFVNPGTLTDSADASYNEVHARSACAIVRNVYFTGAYSEEALIEELGEANYAIALKIAGYETFPETTAAKIAYYL